MQGPTNSFGDIAGGLSKNPLGIIALFIVLVYGFASLVTAFGGSLSASEKETLVYFLALFPVLVLAVFAWLVSCHSNKLYGPSDYKNEENYIRTQLRKEEKSIPIEVDIMRAENAFPECVTLFCDGEYDEAILDLNKAIDKYPNRIEAYILKGEALLKLNKYEDAIQSFNSAIVLRPDDAKLWGKKADALHNDGEYAEAIKAYDEDIRLNPNDANLWSKKADDLHIDGRYAEAIRVYYEAIRLNPNAAKTSEKLDKILEEEKQIRKKLMKYEYRLKSNPNDAYILNSKAWMHYLLEECDDSLQFANKSIELDSKKADPWDTRGAALVRLGKYDEAIESIDRSIELSPKTHYIWYHRGKALEGLGRTTEANAAFIKAKGMGFKGEYLGI